MRGLYQLYFARVLYVLCILSEETLRCRVMGLRRACDVSGHGYTVFTARKSLWVGNSVVNDPNGDLWGLDGHEGSLEPTNRTASRISS